MMHHHWLNHSLQTFTVNSCFCAFVHIGLQSMTDRNDNKRMINNDRDMVEVQASASHEV